MKKILLSLLIIINLTGCNKPSSISKTCSLDNNGMKMDFIVSAKDNNSIIENAKINVEVNFESLGLQPDQLTDEMKDYLKSQLESLLTNQLATNNDYIEVTRSDFTDSGFILSVDLNIKALAATLDNSENLDKLTVDVFVKQMTDSGYSCK